MSPKKIQQLTEKKYRKETGLFLVEGEKNIREVLASDFMVIELLGTRAFLNVIENEVLAYEAKIQDRIILTETTEAELVRTGTFMSNSAGIAIVRQKEEPSLETALADAHTNIVLVLDDVRDPGNLGTIIRTADWYELTHIIASPTTVDFYNSKVITASMGSFTRLRVHYSDLTEVLTQAKAQNLSVLTADMEGTSAHTANLPKSGLLVMGSESHGVSNDAQKFATATLSIPRFGKAESLNVSVATGILLDCLHR
ncbi:MAG: hypothetical protein RLZZ76_393 [Candidatus Parcubacteria bacterium]